MLEQRRLLLWPHRKHKAAVQHTTLTVAGKAFIDTFADTSISASSAANKKVVTYVISAVSDDQQSWFPRLAPPQNWTASPSVVHKWLGRELVGECLTGAYCKGSHCTFALCIARYSTYADIYVL